MIQNLKLNPKNVVFVILCATISVATVMAEIMNPSRVLFVNNERGNDRWDGLAPEPGLEGERGPFRTIQKAFDSVRLSDRIDIANTGIPYQGGNRLSRIGGTPERPMVIEGNGAVICGLDRIPPERWKWVDDRVFSTDFWPMSNVLKGHKDFPFWIGTPQIWWVEDQPAPNVRSEVELRNTPGAFFWNKAEKTVWFNLPADQALEDLKVRIPVHSTGLNIHGSADYVVVQNLHSRFSSNDGFSAHGHAKNLLFRNCIATDNCGQGFSMHDNIRAIVEDSLAERNASSGACDVHGSQVTYRRSVLVNNSFEAGVFAAGESQGVYEECLIMFNGPFEQIWQTRQSSMLFLNCLIMGREDTPLLQMDDGRVRFIQSTLAGFSTLARFKSNGQGVLDIQNSLILVSADHLLPDTDVQQRVQFRYTLIPESKNEGMELPRGVQVEALQLPDQPWIPKNLLELQVQTRGKWYGRDSRIGAQLPNSVWELYSSTRPQD